MKPKVFRRISVRNRSGRLVISLSCSVILPDVGLAMHPSMLNSVVFPDPLGPLRAVALRESMERFTAFDGHEFVGFARVKDFVDILEMDQWIMSS